MMEIFLSPFCWLSWIPVYQLDISSLHVAGVQKLVLQRGPMAWSWREIGQGGSE